MRTKYAERGMVLITFDEFSAFAGRNCSRATPTRGGQAITLAGLDGHRGRLAI